MTINEMLAAAPPAVRRQISRECALRALRIHAAGALRSAGLPEHADTLAALPDDCDLAAAGEAAWTARRAAAWAAEGAAEAAAEAAVETAVGAAAWAAWAAWHAGAAEEAAWAAGAAEGAAEAAAEAAAGDAEREWQKTRLREMLEGPE